MASSSTHHSVVNKCFHAETLDNDLGMNADKAGGYPIGKDCLLWGKKGKLLTQVDREALTCCSCLLLLRHPYQLISCGHRYCEKCLDKLIQSGDSRCLADEELIQPGDVYRDRGCDREIDTLEVDCPGKTQGCEWKGLVKQFEDHKESCTYVVHECKNESGAAEQTVQCSISGCGFKDSLTAMNQHIFEKHSLHFLRGLKELQDELKKKDTQIEEQREKLSSLETRFLNFTRNVSQNVSLSSECAGEFSSPDSYPATSSKPRSINSELAIMAAIETRIVTIEEGIRKLQPAIKQIEEDLSRQASQLSGCFEEVQEIRETASRHVVRMEGLKLRQDILDIKTTNGVLIWKIPDITKRHLKAIEHQRTSSLYSPPFYTVPHGYCACIRLYLNGDGSGKGTHLSVFFVLMRSMHDNILCWPFPYPVNFTLINQVAHPSESISETFLPDPLFSSFQQPKSDMNVGTGFPRFALQSVLSNESFTKGDAIFIKCQVIMKGPNAD